MTGTVLLVVGPLEHVQAGQRAAGAPGRGRRPLRHGFSERADEAVRPPPQVLFQAVVQHYGGELSEDFEYKGGRLVAGGFTRAPRLDTALLLQRPELVARWPWYRGVPYGACYLTDLLDEALRQGHEAQLAAVWLAFEDTGLAPVLHLLDGAWAGQVAALAAYIDSKAWGTTRF